MGTRHLVCVYHKGRFVIAQYGHHNSDPDITGTTILEFLLEPANLAALRAGIPFIRVDQDLSTTGIFGAAVLEHVAEAGDESVEVKISLDMEFASDGLMCSWAYAVDLDAEVLEVYRGYHGPSEKLRGVADAGRFKETNVRGQLLKATFALAELPEEDEFLKACSKPGKKDEVERAPGFGVGFVGVIAADAEGKRTYQSFDALTDVALSDVKVAD